MVCLFVFLSFCLSSSKFILVNWQGVQDTGAESIFELTRVDNGTRKKIIFQHKLETYSFKTTLKLNPFSLSRDGTGRLSYHHRC